ncbi:MAG: DNA replication/repair protein RecF [Alphaproteobacteria bacterium]|nr:DNA replication/repair protein RecF [Alphaproteobacteria bacterium]
MTAHAVSTLHLTGFRCYPTLHLSVGNAPVVLTGSNGAGKTNILEALSFLSPGKGLRQSALADILTRKPEMPTPLAQEWGIATLLCTQSGDHIELGTSYSLATPNKRLIKISGKITRDQKALAEIIHVSWVTPMMDGLFLGSSRERRHFFDRLTYAFHPDHANLVSQYEKLLKERMTLLQEEHFDPIWLHTLEHQLAGLAVAIAANRNDALSIIQTSIDLTLSAFPKALLRIVGQCETWLQEMPAIEAEALLSQSYLKNRDRDRISGRNHVGPQTSDLAVTHGINHMPAHQCSTGEQKALLLSIILAHIRAKVTWHQHPPIVLLDEVVAHLDITRRHALFEELLLLKSQAWLTGTDASLFEGLGGKAQFIKVDAGQCVPCG